MFDSFPTQRQMRLSTIYFIYNGSYQFSSWVPPINARKQYLYSARIKNGVEIDYWYNSSNNNFLRYYPLHQYWEANSEWALRIRQQYTSQNRPDTTHVLRLNQNRRKLLNRWWSGLAEPLNDLYHQWGNSLQHAGVHKAFLRLSRPAGINSGVWINYSHVAPDQSGLKLERFMTSDNNNKQAKMRYQKMMNNYVYYMPADKVSRKTESSLEILRQYTQQLLKGIEQAFKLNYTELAWNQLVGHPELLTIPPYSRGS